MSSKRYHFSELLGKRVLIVGEVGTGKTSMTAELIREAVVAGLEDQVTILDLAPISITLKGRKVSGKVRDIIRLQDHVRYLSSDVIRAPRLEGTSREEVISYANENTLIIARLLNEFMEAPTPILFVNDVSLYLHLGDLDSLEEAFFEAKTVIVNAYEGKILHADYGSGISNREKTQVDSLKTWADIIIKTNRQGNERK